jgi:hypothetical protein
MFRAALVLLLLVAALPARAHSWYSDLHNRNGISCCENQDCSPVELCVLPDRREGLLIDSVCRPIPWDKVLDLPSPDGGAHACWQHFGNPPPIRCVILPGET